MRVTPLCVCVCVCVCVRERERERKRERHTLFCDDVYTETALPLQFCDNNVYIETTLTFPVLRQCKN
jgi:hypothetical protein